MTVVKNPRNPPWTRDETILALALYRRRHPQLPGENDPDIVELSATLNRLARMFSFVPTANYRSPDGVSMKLANLRRLDGSVPGIGLPHGAKMERLVWNEFASKPQELRNEEARIRAAVR